jgi:hypothetical protein
MQSCGFLHVDIDPTGEIVTIDYGGNMGSTVERSVKPNFDALFGKGAFDKIADKGWIAQDHFGNIYDDPSYLWIKKVPVADFPFSLEGLE